MNLYDREQALNDYNKSCDYIAEVFVNKQFGDEETEKEITFKNSAAKLWWTGSRPGGTLCYCDFSFAFDDILTDIRLDASRGQIIRYYDYINRWYDENNGHVKPMSYSTWLYTEAHP